jgi:AcrR family transcriptional regulator
MKREETGKKRGRPRAFDADQALEKAMRVFWKRGYDGASLPELTEAMGINRPSLYAAFGNKESLFRRAVERYVEQGSGLLKESLAQPTARGVVEHLLRGLITQNCYCKTR